MTTIEIEYNFKDLFKEDEWNSIEERYSCLICNELVYKQEWYQCKEGHPGCSKCWNKIISEKGTKQCPFCRNPVQSFSNLSRCRFIEQEFLNKKVLCPYFRKFSINNQKKDDTENGCKEIITIEQLDNHQKNCNARFVKCNNKGCNKVLRYFQNLQHEKECSYSIIKCPHCNEDFVRLSILFHSGSCPSRLITCAQCTSELKKSNLIHHIDNECPKTFIQCQFQQYGCNIHFKRSELSSHLQQVNHIEFMIKLIDEQSQQLKELKESNKKLNDGLENIKQNLNSIYSNKWVISNFNERAGVFESPIYSPDIEIPPHRFNIKISYDLWSGMQCFYLCLKDSIIYQRKINIILSFKILKFKGISNNLLNVTEQDLYIGDAHLCGSLPLKLFSKESDYLFPDGSVQLEFSILVKRPVLNT